MVTPDAFISPLGKVSIPAAAFDEPLRPLVPSLVVHGQGSLHLVMERGPVGARLALDDSEQLREEQRVLDAEPGTRPVVRAARVGGVAGQADDALGVSGEGVL